MPDTETIDGPLESTPEHPRLGPGGPKFEARLRSLDAWDTEWIRPDRRFLQVLLLSEAINGLIGVVLLCIPLILVMTGIWTWPWLWLAILVPALLAASVVINMMLTPRRARAHGYVEREEDLLVRRGVIRHRVNAIPYGRLQYVEVSVGPIDRSSDWPRWKYTRLPPPRIPKFAASAPMTPRACVKTFHVVATTASRGSNE